MNFLDRIARWSIGTLALACVSLVMLAAGCNRGGGAPDSAQYGSPANAPRVETVTVQSRDLMQTVEMPGTVEGYETADLYAKIGGFLEKFGKDASGNTIDIGSHVKKGQELAWLYVPEMEKQLLQKKAMVSQMQAEVEQAQAVIEEAQAGLTSAQAALDETKAERAEKQAQLEFREVSYQRIDGLAKLDSAQSELVDEAKFQLDSATAAIGTVQARIRSADAKLRGAGAHLAKVKADQRTAEARLEVAQADVEELKSRIAYATIRSPYDGIVTKRWVHAGAFIQPADGNSAAKPLLTVTRTETVRIFLDIPMNYVRLLDHGDRALLSRINVLPGKEYEGKITRFSPTLDVESRLMRVEIDLDNPDGKLMPGYYGNVTVYLQEISGTPVIPSSALLTEGEEAYVYVCENGRAKRRVVETNYHDGAWVGITSGLRAGELVVRAGGGQIRDGDAVESVVVELAAAAGN